LKSIKHQYRRCRIATKWSYRLPSLQELLSLCLYTTRQQTHQHNLDELISLNTPCARIIAKHEGGSEASKVSVDMAAGLETVIVLGKGARVMITRNLWQGKGARYFQTWENVACSLV